MLRHCEQREGEGRESRRISMRDKDVLFTWGGGMKMCKERKREGGIIT